VGDRVRRQHTVSKFYLQGFANENGRIKRIDLASGDAIVLSVADASVVKDFYSVELQDGTVTDEFERTVAKIEGPAARALASVLGDGWPLAGEPRLALATWIALQHMRGEGTRSFIGSMESTAIRLMVGWSGKEALRRHIETATGRTIGNEELDLEWADITKPGGPDLAPDPRDHLRQIVEIVPQFAAYLAESHWALVEFSRKALMTSDHPVSLEQDPDQYRGVGIATAELFAIPLDRRRLLTIQPRHHLDAGPVPPAEVADVHARGTAAWALASAFATARYARRYLYLHPDDTVDPRIPIESLGRDYVVETSVGEDFMDENRPFPENAEDWIPVSFHDAPGDARGFSLRDVEWPIPRRRYPENWPAFEANAEPFGRE
jgi:hypothetical protein